MREKILSFFSFVSDSVWDLFPNDPVAYLIYIGGITLFCLFLIFYLAKKSSSSSKKTKKEEVKKEVTIDDLLKIANNPKSSLNDLLSALMLFNEKFSVSDNKDKSLELFEKILNHNNRNKALFDYFHGSILPKNIPFKNELDELEKKALNSMK